MGAPRFLSRLPAALFWLAIGTWVAYTNWVFARMLPAPIPLEDSHGYFGWSLVRTIGYPALLSAYDAVTSTWTFFPLLQLNLVLAGLVTLCWATARVTGSYALGWIVLAIAAACSRLPLFAAYVMTEAAFAAAVMLHLASMFVALASYSRTAASLAGASLAAAVLIKSVGVVLVAPGVLLAAILPAPGRRVFVLAVIPALLAWFAPSAVNLVRYGFFESSVLGGYALAGHVASAIQPRPGSPNPELAARIAARLAPVLASRPDWRGSREAYATHTSDEYNTLLWANIVPETAAHFAKECPGDYFQTCTWRQCPAPCSVHTNRSLMALARDAIRAQPWDYAYHVFAHDERSWLLVFHRPVDFLRGAGERASELPHYYLPTATHARPWLEPVPAFDSTETRAALEAGMERHLLRQLADVLTLDDAVRNYLVKPLEGSAARLPALIGLLASMLVLVGRRLSSAGLAFCYTGLCLHAYFLGTSLFQPALERYSWPMQAVVAALLATGIGWAAHVMAGRWRVRRRER